MLKKYLCEDNLKLQKTDEGFAAVFKENIFPEKQEQQFWFMYLDFKTDLDNML